MSKFDIKPKRSIQETSATKICQLKHFYRGKDVSHGGGVGYCLFQNSSLANLAFNLIQHKNSVDAQDARALGHCSLLTALIQSLVKNGLESKDFLLRLFPLLLFYKGSGLLERNF